MMSLVFSIPLLPVVYLFLFIFLCCPRLVCFLSLRLSSALFSPRFSPLFFVVTLFFISFLFYSLFLNHVISCPLLSYVLDTMSLFCLLLGPIPHLSPSAPWVCPCLGGAAASSSAHFSFVCEQASCNLRPIMCRPIWRLKLEVRVPTDS